MVIVTGTKRSGTSMWMQILIAAGLPAFGEAFPGEWKSTLRQANPEGFYESMLRQGIYFATNPHPQTGAYFFPEQVQHHCVKVFIPGLVRTDRAYIGHVIATVREWREQEASLDRLHAMEDEQRARAERGGVGAPARLPAALEWWTENFALIRDIHIRRYPVHVQSYDGLLADPEKVIGQTLRWLGRGDEKAACEMVKPEHRNQKRPASASVEPEIAAVFDELYDAIDRALGITPQLVARLNETNEKLLPVLRAHQERIRAELARRREAGTGATDAATEPLDGPG